MKREGKKEGGGEILEVGKGARDVAEWQRIENTKQRRDKREHNRWNGQGSSLCVRVACPTVSSSTFIAV